MNDARGAARYERWQRVLRYVVVSARVRAIDQKHSEHLSNNLAKQSLQTQTTLKNIGLRKATAVSVCGELRALWRRRSSPGHRLRRRVTRSIMQARSRDSQADHAIDQASAINKHRRNSYFVGRCVGPDNGQQSARTRLAHSNLQRVSPRAFRRRSQAPSHDSEKNDHINVYAPGGAGVCLHLPLVF